MKERASIVVTLTLLGSLILVNHLMADEKAEKAALASSTKWLELVDRGGYSKSWDRAAVIFRAMVTRGEWENKLSMFRTPLGKVSERNVKSKVYTQTLPEAPKGEYVVIQYETTFANKQAVTETVTCVLEKDGKWKIGGYYITFPGQESQPSSEKKKE